MSAPLTGSQKRELKSRAQRMDETVRVGHAGLSEGFLAALHEELARNELVKVRFSDHKEQRKELSAEIAEKTGSQLIQMVGNVAVFFRAKPKAAKATASEKDETAESVELSSDWTFEP